MQGNLNYLNITLPSPRLELSYKRQKFLDKYNLTEEDGTIKILI